MLYNSIRQRPKGIAVIIINNNKGGGEKWVGDLSLGGELVVVTRQRKSRERGEPQERRRSSRARRDTWAHSHASATLVFAFVHHHQVDALLSYHDVIIHPMRCFICMHGWSCH